MHVTHTVPRMTAAATIAAAANRGDTWLLAVTQHQVRRIGRELAELPDESWRALLDIGADRILETPMARIVEGVAGVAEVTAVLLIGKTRMSSDEIARAFHLPFGPGERGLDKAVITCGHHQDCAPALFDEGLSMAVPTGSR